MKDLTKNHSLHLALTFAGAAVTATLRKSKGKRGSGTRASGGGKSNKFKGLFQFNDVDEDKVARLSRRKQMMSKTVAAAVTPMAVWMQVVTQTGMTIMMNADQFEAGGAGKALSATPHFS